MLLSQPNFTTFIIALSGGIASGKTAVSDTFFELGASIVDTDIIARDVVIPGSQGLDEITEQFGSQVLLDNGQLNRPALRSIIFTDKNKRKLLESMLHPLIRTESIRQLQQAKTTLAVLVIPLLAENMTTKNSYQWVDRILVVDVEESVQIKRLTDRDKTTPMQAKAILASQASRAQRLAIADDILVNNTNFAELNIKVIKFYNHYCQLANEKNSNRIN